MGNHPFNVIVVLFWLATMSWLVVAKVLPPLRVGEPPSYRSILDQSQKQLPVCWNIRLQDKSIGWAANRVERRPDGITELVSRVYLQDVPLDRFAPPGSAKCSARCSAGWVRWTSTRPAAWSSIRWDD